jgi:hypothetical protein
VAEPDPEPEASAAALLDPAAQLRWVAALARLERVDAAWLAGAYPAFHVAGSMAPMSHGDPRLMAFRALWDDAMADLLAAVARTTSTQSARGTAAR